MKKINTILHIIDTTGPGGAETVFIELLTHLSRQQYRPVVLIRGKGWVYEELCRHGIVPILLDAKGSFNWRYLKSMVNLIRSEKVDLIQSHLLGSNVYSCLAGLLTKVPVVATFHGAVDIGLNERLKSLKFTVINHGAASIVAVSDSLRLDIINRTSLRKDKISVVYNGIDISAFHRSHSDTLREKFGWSNDDVIVGSLGNIRSAKGYDVLLRAAALLKDSEQTYRFVIAGQGSGKLYNDLLNLQAELGLEKSVFFLGFNDDPASFLSNLDLFLLSSATEGFSIATIQAMASGLPVIVTRSGGPQEIVTHAQNGWLIEPGNAEEMAQAVQLLSTDPTLSGSLAAKGYEHAKQKFNMNLMLKSYERIYKALIQ